MRQQNQKAVLYTTIFWMSVYIAFFTDVSSINKNRSSFYETPGKAIRNSFDSGGIEARIPHNTTGLCHTLHEFQFPDSVYEYNCTMLFHNNTVEADRALEYRRIPLDDKAYLESLPATCEELIRSHNYIVEPLNEEEANFPIAYSLMVFRNSEQVGRLLRAIYRPQNYYCIHVDIKADEKFFSLNGTDNRLLCQCFPSSQTP